MALKTGDADTFNSALLNQEAAYRTDKTNPNDKDHGTGGRNAADGNNIRLVVGGGYYMGRWLSAQPATDDGNGIICYFGE